MALNVITVTFGPGMKVARTKKRTRGDYGQYLDIKGLDGILPSVFEVHFSNTKENAGTAKPQIGQNGRVQIPYEYLNTGRTVYGWIFLHEGEHDGTSEYIVIIENNSKPTVVDETPTPDEERVIGQLIGAMNTAVAKTAADVISADASAQAAAQSATEAQTAARSAQGSATSASASATTASAQAATATSKASEAATSAANAASAKTAAETAETNAKAAQTASESAQASAESAAQTATSKASEAATSATSASGSATAASASASQASESATQAANSATAASGSATAAATSASTASTKASEASASATTANTAKTAAQTAQTAAEAAQTAAETAAATFETDTTLTVVGKAADAKATGDAVNDLKSSITLIEGGMLTGYLPVSLGTLIPNKYYTKAGNRANYNGWSCTDYIELPDGVTELQIDSIASSGGNYNAFYNSSNTFISNFSFEIGTNRLSIPTNAKYIALSAETATMQALSLSEVLPFTDKLESGFYSLDDEVINNNWGYISIPTVGETVDYTVVPDSNLHYGVFDVVKGDTFKITGAGGNASRLWAFVDTNDVVISKSAANLSTTTPFIIIAPDNGKLIYNSHYTKIYIWKQAKNATEVYQKSIAQAEYDYRNRGLDVLSAFTNVSCFGDSLTASVVYTHDNGDGTHQVRSAYKKYPMILGQKIGATAESVATGGYNATDWWGDYASRIVEKENQLVVIYLGTNGGLTQTVDTDAVGDDYTQYANTNTGNYCKIVKKSLDVGAKVLLIKIHNGGGGNTFITNAAIDDIATRFNVAVVDVPFLYDRCYHAYPDNTGINDLHYNDLGYSAFAESLIRNIGALSSDMKIRLIPT